MKNNNTLNNLKGNLFISLVTKDPYVILNKIDALMENNSNINIDISGNVKFTNIKGEKEYIVTLTLNDNSYEF